LILASFDPHERLFFLVFVALVAAIYKNLPHAVFSKKAAHLIELRLEGVPFVRIAFQAHRSNDSTAFACHRQTHLETYTAEQGRTIMDAIAANHLEAVPFFAISFFAGTRLGEIIKLEWQAFTDDGQLGISAAVNKTRTKRFATATPTLQA
jgi:hypothetical protein